MHGIVTLFPKNEPRNTILFHKYDDELVTHTLSGLSEPSLHGDGRVPSMIEENLGVLRSDDSTKFSSPARTIRDR
jgi:hypothetical protein